MRKNCLALLLILTLVFSTLTAQAAAPAVEVDLPRSEAALSLMEYL